MGISEANAPKRILLVEEEQSLSRMLCISLRNTGYSVTEAATSEEAIDALQGESADAVVLDMGPPDDLGGAVLERILHRGQPGAGPAWVVLSGLDRWEATQRYGPLGNHFMAKPFDPWDLVRTLDELLAGAAG